MQGRIAQISVGHSIEETETAMRPHQIIIPGILQILLFPGLIIAQDEEPPPQRRHEVSFGVGVAFPFEKDPLNIAGEEKVPPCTAISFLYRYHINTRFSAGLQLVGYTWKTPPYIVESSESITQNLSFTLVSVDFGVHVRYAFLDGPLRPYTYVMINYVGGSVENGQTGTLNQSGFAVGGGVGITWMVIDAFGLSFEGLGNFGSAKWKQKPFSNSTGSDYDPSMVALLISASYYWGE